MSLLGFPDDLLLEGSTSGFFGTVVGRSGGPPRLSSVRSVDGETLVVLRSSSTDCALSHSLTLGGPLQYERCPWSRSDSYPLRDTDAWVGGWGVGVRKDLSPSLGGL